VAVEEKVREAARRGGAAGAVAGEAAAAAAEAGSRRASAGRAPFEADLPVPRVPTRVAAAGRPGTPRCR